MKMGLSAGIRLPILVLSKRINYPIHSGFGYNTAAHKTHSIYEFRENRNIFPSDFTYACCGLGILSRRYSIEVSASDQVTLIKQLRGRTSAAIKDVKCALIDSNWDIEAAQKELRKRGVVLASKKASRAAAEGLLAVDNQSYYSLLVYTNETTWGSY